MTITADTDTDTGRPVVVFIRGMPGSGKSTVAAALYKTLAGQAIVLDPDATDYDSQDYKRHSQALTAEGVDPQLHAYRYLRGQAYEAIAAGKIIIWNQPFSNREIFHKVVGRLHEQAALSGKALSLLIVEVDIDRAVAEARVVARKAAGGHGPSPATFSRFVNDHQSFAGEGIDVVTVNGQDDTETSVHTIVQALSTSRASR